MVAIELMCRSFPAASVCFCCGQSREGPKLRGGRSRQLAPRPKISRPSCLPNFSINRTLSTDRSLP